MPKLPNEPAVLTQLRKIAKNDLFGKMAVKRVEGMRFGVNVKTSARDLDLPWVPGGRYYKSASAMARRCVQALELGRSALKKLARIDHGEKSHSGGRVLVTGTVVEVTAAFLESIGGSTAIRHVLRMKDSRERLWDETVKIVEITANTVECLGQ